MSKQVILKISWKTYINDVQKLYKIIKSREDKFDNIIAINRGGNIIGTILSHKMRLPLKVIDKNEMVDLRGHLLIVEDISDSGKTFMNVINNLKEHISFKTAALYVKPDTRYFPNYYVREVSKWVVYPYEESDL